MRTQETLRAELDIELAKTVKLIGFSSWYEQAGKVLTKEEQDEVTKLYNTKNGRACWNDAFLEWFYRLPI